MKPYTTDRPHIFATMARYHLFASVALVFLLGIFGCTTPPKVATIRENRMQLVENTILHGESATVRSPRELFRELDAARVVYVGEQHTNATHHSNQLAVIEALFRTSPDLTIGMEMFDHTYQPVLDQWRVGELEETEFLEKTHWYANWRFNFDLYRDILEFAKQNRIRIVALNLPFHIPGKISTGGISSLLAEDRRHLPASVTLTDAAHRAYVEDIFKMHAVRGRKNFDYFYEAQCVWEDAMAEAVADNLGAGKMVVIIGNGHIIRKFGVPKRAFARNPVPFKTVYLTSVGTAAELSWADYLWVTPEAPKHHMGMR